MPVCWQLRQPTRLLADNDRELVPLLHQAGEEWIQPAAKLGRVRERQALDIRIELDLELVGVFALDLGPRTEGPREPRRHLSAFQQVRVQLLDLLLELPRSGRDCIWLVDRQQAAAWHVVDQRIRAKKPAVELQR